MLSVRIKVEIWQSEHGASHSRIAREIDVILFGDDGVDHAVKVAERQVRQAVDDLELTTPPMPIAIETNG